MNSYFIGMNMGNNGGSGGGGDVLSVNGKTGVVIITSSDIRFNNNGTNLTSTRLQDVVVELNDIIANSNIDIQNIELRLDDDLGKVKMIASDTLGYLEDKVDGTTMQNVANKLVAKSLDGLLASITELNYLQGAKSNIQAQIDSLSNVGNFTGAVDKHSDLANVQNPSTNDMIIVIEDETKLDKSTIYTYNGNQWVFVGEFKVEMRNFTTNPIDLTTEVTGVLPLSNIDSSVVNNTQIDISLLNKFGINNNGKLLFDGSLVCDCDGSNSGDGMDLIDNEF